MRALAAILFAMSLSAQAQNVSDIPPLPMDRAGECLTYMRPLGQYTHPDIGPFTVGIFRDEQGAFWTVRLEPGYKPKEGDEVVVTGNTLTL